MIKEIQGNLFDSDADVLAHGVNCMGLMSSGIAVEFKNRFPEMHDEYILLCDTEQLSPGDVFLYQDDQDDSGLVIANLASQQFPGADARYYWTILAIARTVQWMEESFNYDSLAIPRIGTGVGGLDWKVMRSELFANFAESPVTIEVWSL